MGSATTSVVRLYIPTWTCTDTLCNFFQHQRSYDTDMFYTTTSVLISSKDHSPCHDDLLVDTRSRENHHVNLLHLPRRTHGQQLENPRKRYRFFRPLLSMPGDEDKVRIAAGRPPILAEEKCHLRGDRCASVVGRPPILSRKKNVT